MRGTVSLISNAPTVAYIMIMPHALYDVPVVAHYREATRAKHRQMNALNKRKRSID
jgi:hypothetical protein